ncbi:MAG TPA: hypothetical protein VKA34_00635, partial [Balneolales bacterium]|nr:hypothetical protein [Balneolales bacterium]
KGMTFKDITFPADSLGQTLLEARNLNGWYVISGRVDTGFTIDAYPSSQSGYTKTAVGGGKKIEATVTTKKINWTIKNPT